MEKQSTIVRIVGFSEYLDCGHIVRNEESGMDSAGDRVGCALCENDVPAVSGTLDDLQEMTRRTVEIELQKARDE